MDQGKPAIVFGTPFGSKTAMGQPVLVKCGYLKCGISFWTYELSRKYCSLRHKDAESTRMRREKEKKMGVGMAAPAASAAALDMADRVQRAKSFTDTLETSEGQRKAFEDAVKNAMKWLKDGMNALGPFTLEHIADDKVRQEVTRRIAAGEVYEEEPDETSAAIHAALGLGAAEVLSEPIQDAPAADYAPKPKTDAEKAEEL